MKKAVVELAYDEFGTPGNPPLVILHGFFASARNWRQIATQLANQFHVYVLNLRNHGASPHSPHMTYPLMAEDLQAFWDHHGLQRAFLLGHSMGGKVAMWFSLLNPQHIERLIVVDIAPVLYDHSFDAIIRALMALPLDELGNRKQADNRLAAAIPEFGFRQFLLQNLVLREQGYHWRIDLEIFLHNAPNIVAFPETQGVPAYASDVLFMTGSNSDYILPRYKAAVYALFPAAKISQIPDAGHWLHAEQPRVFTQTVREFLIA